MRLPDKTIVLASALVPFPPARGVELRIYRLLQWLRDEGYLVVLVLAADSMEVAVLAELKKVAHRIHWTRPALRTRLGRRFPKVRRFIWERYKRFGTLPATVDVGHVRDAAAKKTDISNAFASAAFCALVETVVRSYQPAAVIVEYIFSTPVLAGLPAGVLKIVDTIDVFSRKEQQVLAFGIHDEYACSEKEERAYLLQADVIIAIQAAEERILREIVPERRVVLAGIDLHVDTSLSIADEVSNLVAVIGSDNALNVHGLREFLERCWPLIKKSIPDVRLQVIGKVGDKCRFDDPSISYSGWVTDLNHVYRQAMVVINPTVAGTGLKVKSVEALAHGKPLVAWANGVEGLSFTGEAPFVLCQSWTEFAAAVSELLRDEKRRRRLSERALAYARDEFGAAKVYASLSECLAQASELVNAGSDQ